ncbi:MAG: hypothetical protein BA862_00670 [Desulfobulbaceae bacterium S3730MH12]|nr:MAG: hypothetical protein BA866_13990 [Desulfobulbaceae bacterium S5133MH15]OEU55229.1 MAG: hypothetical protein BA862_00670 [Desulfobulbaceae bacterium S3730MH12]OEU82619.1 MAG: hypothetical protein BA873_13385 [Desulfobulbaceae bacterium C00003063]
MAEIKSTMEMVLERAAKMAEEAPPVTDDDSLIKKGMRIGADFLNKKIADLHKELLDQPAENQIPIRKGMAQTLLRNIVLPRDEELQQSAAVAIKGILSLAQNSGEISSICGELQQILEQYGQHKEQSIQQLEDALRSQLEQQQTANGQTEQGTINPTMHPQYREELSKMLTSLNNQYNDALTERKEMILSRLCP